MTGMKSNARGTNIDQILLYKVIVYGIEIKMNFRTLAFIRGGMIYVTHYKSMLSSKAYAAKVARVTTSQSIHQHISKCSIY